MYTKDNKVYYTWEDFENAVRQCGIFIRNMKNVHIVTLYRGGLPLGVRLSNEFKLPLSILDYQSYDGKSKSVQMLKNADIESTDVLFLVDDIADSGNTINKAKEFLYEFFPKNKLYIFTIFGNEGENQTYQYKHDGKWVIFPWEERV